MNPWLALGAVALVAVLMVTAYGVGHDHGRAAAYRSMQVPDWDTLRPVRNRTERGAIHPGVLGAVTVLAFLWAGFTVGGW